MRILIKSTPLHIVSAIPLERIKRWGHGLFRFPWICASVLLLWMSGICTILRAFGFCLLALDSCNSIEIPYFVSFFFQEFFKLLTSHTSVHKRFILYVSYTRLNQIKWRASFDIWRIQFISQEINLSFASWLYKSINLTKVQSTEAIDISSLAT